MTQRTTDVLLKMVDAVRDVLSTIEATGLEGESDMSAVVADIQSVLDGTDDGAANSSRRRGNGSAARRASR